MGLQGISSHRLASIRVGGIVGAAFLLSFACSQDPLANDDDENIEIVGIEVTPKSASLEPNQTQTFQARGLTQTGTLVSTSVTWKASGGEIDAQGVFQAQSGGEYQVIATHTVRTWLSDTVAASVAEPPLPLTTWPEQVSVAVNDSVTLRAFFVTTDEDTVDAQVEWAASGGGTVEDRGEGRARFKAGAESGNYLVTASHETGGKDTVFVEITERSVATIEVAPETVTLSPGASAQLVATLKDEDGEELTGRSVEWITSDDAVVVVASDGMIVGVAAGTAQVTATIEGKSAAAQVTVTPTPVASVTVSPTSAEIVEGETHQFVATAHDAGGSVLPDRPFAWTVDDTDVATVNTSGLVSANAAGTAQLTVTSEGQSATASITVTVRPVASVVVAPSDGVIEVDDVIQLSATTLDDGGNELTGRTVSWSSANSGIATVDSNGEVTGVAEGQTTITATSEGESGTATITVSDALEPVATVEVSPATAGLEEGETAQLDATARDAGGNVLPGRVVTWTSSDEDIATVGQQTGLVTATGPGTATISATSEGQVGTATITVTAVPVVSVEVSPSTGSLTVGEIMTLSATPRDADGDVLTGRSVSWSSSNGSVASVNQNGAVTGNAVGTAEITATSEGQSGSATITVAAVPVASVSVTPSSASLTVGEQVTLSATPRDASGNPLTGRSVTWSTSSGGVAGVGQNGTVTANGAGTATITASSEGESGTATVTVAAVPVASVDVTPSAADLVVGEQVTLTATPEDANGDPLTGRSVTWSTSNSGIASVNQNGRVTANAPGTATISATSEGETGTATVSVSEVPVASVEVTPSSVSLTVGQTASLSATPIDASGNPLMGRTVTWNTSDGGIATVNQSGLVTAQGTGSATITATSEGQSGSGTVTVAGTGASVDTLFFDGFESGGLGSWHDVFETQSGNHQVITDASLAQSGSRLLRIRYPEGRNGGGAATRFIQPGVDRMYVRYYVHIPTNFQGGTKLLLLRGSREDNIWSSFGKGSACPQGDDFFVTNIVTRNSSSLPLRFYTYYPGMQTEPGGTVCYGRYGDDASPPAEYFGSLDLSKGVWHQLEFEVRLNDPGQANGVQRFWLDGVLKGEWQGLVFRTTTDLMLNGVTLETSMNETSSSPQTQEIYVDELLVTTARPN